MKGVKNIVTLNDITSRIGDGLHGTPKYDENGDYYFINGNNLSGGKIVIKSDTKRISSEEYHKIKKELNQRTILLAINGTIGNLGFYNGENVALGKSACYLNIKDDVDKNYIRYVLEHEEFQKYALAFATGATIKNLGLKAVRDYKFNLPPLPTQRRIASILSAYDDLIENNLKRIKLLEEIAQRTYEEWFVKFRVNGEQLPIDEKTGLPVGWERKKLIDVADITMGQSPKSEYYNKEGKGLPFHQGVSDYGFRFPKNTSWSLQGNRFAKEGDILFSVRAPVGRLNIALEKIILGRGLSAICHKKQLTNGLFYQLQNVFFKDDIIGGGAIFNSVTKNDIERIPIIHCDNVTEKNFDIFACNFNNKIKILSLQIQKLKESRDILLPKLMNGTINVEKDA